MHRFSTKIAGHALTLSAELTVRRESTADDVRRQVDSLAPWVDAVQATDNPYAWVQMSALTAAALVLEQGVDCVPILTCRDRNRDALRSELLGLRALGASSVLLARGPQVPKEHPLRAATVFDLSGQELIALATALGDEFHDEGFFIGTAASVFRPRQRWRAEALVARADIGARFMQTQVCFNVDLLRAYMERLCAVGLDQRLAVVVALSPIPSAETARWMQQKMRDIRIPDSLIQALEAASDPRHEGIRLCAEAMREVADIPGISGISLMTTGDPEAIIEAIEASGLRS